MDFFPHPYSFMRLKMKQCKPAFNCSISNVLLLSLTLKSAFFYWIDLINVFTLTLYTVCHIYWKDSNTCRINANLQKKLYILFSQSQINNLISFQRKIPTHYSEHTSRKDDQAWQPGSLLQNFSWVSWILNMHK